jgi:RNA polymerase sigma-70 factor, ECF subfamily
MEQLASLLAENVVLHGDGGGKAPATRKLIVVRVEVAHFILASRARTVMSVEEIDLNGAPAIVVKAPDRVIAAIMLDTDGERICAVFGLSNPDKLHSLTPLVSTTIAS